MARQLNKGRLSLDVSSPERAKRCQEQTDKLLKKKFSTWIYWGRAYGDWEYRCLEQDGRFRDYAALSRQAFETVRLYHEAKGHTRPDYQRILRYWWMEQLLIAYWARYPGLSFTAHFLAKALAGLWRYTTDEPLYLRKFVYGLYLRPTSLYAQGYLRCARSRDLIVPQGSENLSPRHAARATVMQRAKQAREEGDDKNPVLRVTSYFHTPLTPTEQWPPAPLRDNPTTIRVLNKILGPEWATQYFPDPQQLVEFAAVPFMLDNKQSQEWHARQRYLRKREITRAIRQQTAPLATLAKYLRPRDLQGVAVMGRVDPQVLARYMGLQLPEPRRQEPHGNGAAVTSPARASSQAGQVGAKTARPWAR